MRGNRAAFLSRRSRKHESAPPGADLRILVAEDGGDRLERKSSRADATHGLRYEERDRVDLAGPQKRRGNSFLAGNLRAEEFGRV